MTRFRAAAASVVLVLAAVLVPVSTTAWWVSGTLTDTDTYVATVAPLATDPEVVAVAEEALTNQIVDLIQKQQLLDKTSTALENQGLSPVVVRTLGLLAEPLRERVQVMVSHVVGSLLESQAFADAWTEANRTAHDELIAVLNGDHPVSVQDGMVSLDIATLSNAIKNALVNAGVPGAELLPTLQASLPIAKVADLESAQAAYSLLNAAGRWLPLLTLLIAAGGVALSRDRRRAGLSWAAGSIGGMLILLVALAVTRRSLLAGLPGPPPHPAAASGFDILVERLRSSIGVVAAALLAICVLLVFAGRSTQAVTLRNRARDAWATAVELARERAWVRASAWILAGVLLLTLILSTGTSVPVSVLLALGAAAAAGIAYLARSTGTPIEDSKGARTDG